MRSCTRPQQHAGWRPKALDPAPTPRVTSSCVNSTVYLRPGPALASRRSAASACAWAAITCSTLLIARTFRSLPLVDDLACSTAPAWHGKSRAGLFAWVDVPVHATDLRSGALNACPSSAGTLVALQPSPAAALATRTGAAPAPARGPSIARYSVILVASSSVPCSIAAARCWQAVAEAVLVPPAKMLPEPQPGKGSRCCPCPPPAAAAALLRVSGLMGVPCSPSAPPPCPFPCCCLDKTRWRSLRMRWRPRSVCSRGARVGPAHVSMLVCSACGVTGWLGTLKRVCLFTA